MTIWRSNSICWVLLLKYILMSFLLLCFLLLLSPKHWHYGISGDRILRSSAAFSLQFCSKIHLACSGKFRTTSFQIQGPRKDQWPRGNLSVCSFFSHTSSFPFVSHTMSLNIDMKMILPVKFSGSHCNSPIC